MRLNKFKTTVVIFCMALFGLTGVATTAQAVPVETCTAIAPGSVSAEAVVATLLGSGTESDPYLISSRSDLEAIDSPAYLYGCFYFKQTVDIDLSSEPWIPIGFRSDSVFQGYYDGNGKSIMGMTVTRNYNMLGLFSHAVTSYVHDLNIEGSINPISSSICGLDRSVTACTIDENAVGPLSGEAGYTDYAGGLAGAFSGRIENVVTNVTITNGRMNVGGLVGFLYSQEFLGDFGSGDPCDILPIGCGDPCEIFGLCIVGLSNALVQAVSSTSHIVNSQAKGSISASSNINPVGDDAVRQCVSMYGIAWGVIPDSESRAVGGLVGAACGTHEVISSKASGDISVKGDQSTAIGGLIGLSSLGVISNSSATGNIALTAFDGTNCGDDVCNVDSTDGIGAQYVGGLVGWDFYGSIMDSNASGKIDASAIPSRLIGGLVGLFGSEVAIGSGYYSDQCGVAPGLHDSYATGDVIGNSDSSWYVGGLVGAANSNCIFIISNGSVLDNSYATGNVTGSVSVGGLLGISGFFKSINNTYATGNVTSTSPNYYVDLYGTGGLIGSMIFSSVVSNSHASGAVTSASGYTGGLIGSTLLGMVVSDSYATGAVNSVGEITYETLGVGGLVGFAGLDNQFTRVYATGDVSATNSEEGGAFAVGGLIGGSIIGLTVNKAYATGSVTSSGEGTGGLIGAMCLENAGTCVLQNVYSRGNVSTSVTGIAFTAGLVGYVPDDSVASIINAYSTSVVSAPANAAAVDSFAFAPSMSYSASSATNFFNSAFGTSTKATGKTTAELKTASTYPSSWDFNSIWGLDTRATSNLVNDGYPYLREIVGALPAIAAIAPVCAPVIMPKIGFAKNSAKLTKKSKAALRVMAKQIAASHCKGIEITGYAAKSKLATKRTNAVMSYLRGRLYNEGALVTMNLKKVHGKKVKLRRAEIALMS
jgi:hypothetical protein